MQKKRGLPRNGQGETGREHANGIGLLPPGCKIINDCPQCEGAVFRYASGARSLGMNSFCHQCKQCSRIYVRADGGFLLFTDAIKMGLPLVNDRSRF